LFLIVLIGFCTLMVYHMREGQLSIWLGITPPPPVASLPGEAPLEGIVGNDTVIETTIKPAAFSNRARPRFTRRPGSRWDRPSIEAGELLLDSRRSSANAPAVPGIVEADPARLPPSEREGSVLNLVNPGSSPGPIDSGPSPTLPQEEVQAPPAPAQPRQPTVTHKTHLVKDGDKLWNLAEKYLGAGHRYPEIIELNKNELDGDPDRLRPGMKLKIPSKK